MKSFPRNIRFPVLISLLFLLVFVSGICTAQNIGYLSVTSQPEHALVYLDGEYTNSRTPTSRLLTAEPGQHTIELSKQGYKLYNGKVIIEQGKALEVNLILTEIGSEEASKLTDERYIEAYLTVESRPVNADVHLDDKYVGKTPVVDHKIQPGEPRDIGLRIVKPGYKTHEESVSWVDIRDRVKIYISAKLEREEQAADHTSPANPRKGKKFAVNTQVIALSVLLAILIAVLITRLIIRFRQRAGDD